MPFSYLDVRLAGSAVDLTLVVHAFDLAHDLGVEPPDRLLDPAVLDSSRSGHRQAAASRV